jgi:hypothetical protein
VYLYDGLLIPAKAWYIGAARSTRAAVRKGRVRRSFFIRGELIMNPFI